MWVSDNQLESDSLSHRNPNVILQVKGLHIHITIYSSQIKQLITKHYIASHQINQSITKHPIAIKQLQLG
jgi:hypothetical protein